MVRVTAEDLQDDDLGLLEYLSSDSDSDLEEQENDPEKRQIFAEIEPEVPFSASFPNVLIIAGLPCVAEDKFDKLRNALTKRILTELTERGVLTVNEETKLLPDGSPPFTTDFPVVKQEDGSVMTAGVCFITFKDAFEATKTAGYLKNIGLDAKHPFCVCTVDELDVVTGENNEPNLPNEIGFFRSDFRDWLCDPLGREQFAYRCGTTSDIMWHDAIERVPKSVLSQQDKLGTAVCWSPMGSYLITFHKRGIWLRGDNSFGKKISFTHTGVKYILFSPNEEYLVTWDGTNSNVNNDQAVIVWHVFSGKKLRTFPTPQYSTNGVRTDEGGSWPFFLFSPDSKYLAMRRERDIVVYETATMLVLEDPSSSALGKKERTPLNYPAEQFQWSPTANLLSIWISEYNDAPGRLLLVDIPSRQEVSSKNVFSVKNVSMHWHPRGEFMALRTVISRKKGKKTKKETTQIEVFRVKDKSIPVDTINIEDARVKSLHWELGQHACRFATLTVNELTSNQYINFYNVPVKGPKQDTELVETLAVPHGISTFEWSPAGKYFVAASKGSDGTLIFGCFNESNKVEVIQKDEHFDLTDIFWDPSGRYVTTAVLIPTGMTSYRITSNAGFRIYSFLGRLQFRLSDEKCSQFLWRPRPASLLPASKIEDVHKKLKEYSKKYDAQDDLRRQTRSNALKQECSGKLVKFMERCQAVQTWMQSHPRYAEWKEAGELLSDYMDWYEKPTTWEEVIEVTRELVKKAGK